MMQYVHRKSQGLPSKYSALESMGQRASRLFMRRRKQGTGACARKLVLTFLYLCVPNLLSQVWSYSGERSGERERESVEGEREGMKEMY